MSKLISIVTISFNQAKYLEAAMRSVLEQDYPAIEYIVVDPGSTDGSRAIIERYRSRIAKVVYEPDSGAAEGLNHGFAHATGEIFGYLNADDVYLPGAISGMARVFQRRPEMDVVFGDGYFVDADGVATRRCLSTRFNARMYERGAVTVMQQSTFFRADAFRSVGGFRVENRTCWDGELVADMSRQGKRFWHEAQYWSAFRLHEASITGSSRLTEQYMREQERVFAGIKRSSGQRRLARLWRYAANPRVPLLRVGERVFGPPAVTV